MQLWAITRKETVEAQMDAPPPVLADEAPPPETRIRKKGIALALGGGAARGWAHIGVLRAGSRLKTRSGTSGPRPGRRRSICCCNAVAKR